MNDRWDGFEPNPNPMSWTEQAGRCHSHRREEVEGSQGIGGLPTFTPQGHSHFLSFSLKARAPLLTLLGCSECPGAETFLLISFILLSLMKSNGHLFN